MRSTIGGVELFAMAYAWSRNGVSYFLSTCGKTSRSATMYKTHFEDDFGNVQTRDINRPEIAHFLYDYLPLIDEHNLRTVTGRSAENLAQFNFRALEHARRANEGGDIAAALLVRIKDADGSVARAVTTKQQNNGRSVGTSRQQSCFICRKYKDANGKTVFQSTSFGCAMCFMPLCKHARGRAMTCLQEHKLSAHDDVLGCTSKHVRGTLFPKSKQVDMDS